MSWIFFATFALQGPLLIVGKYLPRYFDYIFFVYPGEKRDMRGVVPYWFSKYKYFRTKIFIGGIVTNPKEGFVGRGLIVGAPSTTDSMLSSREEVLILQRNLQKFAQSLSIVAIAIAGRGPSIFVHHKIELDKPFVYGRRGMVFCTVEILRAVSEKHNLSLREQKVVIFGGGYVGKAIGRFLQSQDCSVETVTARSILQNRLDVKREDLHFLREADIVIVISARGSDVYPYMKNLKKGVILIDDAHPRITKKLKQGYLYRAALCLRGAEFTPPLPVYGKESIPGCAVEAMTQAVYGHSIKTQQDFNEKAYQMGFIAYNI
jgi:hypothetical protein